MKLKAKLVMMALALPLMTFAQEEKSADEYKNEGNEFVRAKNYQDALASYQKAIELWGDSIDKPTVYNAADCAKRTGQNETAIQLYQKAVELGYKADYSSYFIAELYGKMGKKEERLAQLEAGVETYKEGKVAGFFKKALTKEYLQTALADYNEGNKILNECQTAKPEQYAAIQARAKEQFKEALPLVEKALTLSPDNETAVKMAENIKEQLK